MSAGSPPGMPATFTVDAYPGRPFTGRLRQIRNAAQTIQNVVTYDAVIDVENPNLLLKPGMTANVTFIAAQKDNVVRVRNAALRFQPDPQLLARIGIEGPRARQPRAPDSQPQDGLGAARRPAGVCRRFPPAFPTARGRNWSAATSSRATR